MRTPKRLCDTDGRTELVQRRVMNTHFFFSIENRVKRTAEDDWVEGQDTGVRLPTGRFPFSYQKKEGDERRPTCDLQVQ